MVDYPTSLDSFTKPTSSDDLDTPGVELDVVTANALLAVEALEAKVGVDDSADEASLDARIAALESGGSRFSLTMTEILFTETAGAGVYTAEVPVDAGTVLMSFRTYALGLWDATTVTLGIGDSAGAEAIAAAGYCDVKALELYAPTGVLTDYSINNAGGDDGTQDFVYQGKPGIRYPAPDTITATVTTTGAGGGTGRLLVVLFGFGLPPEHVDAVKT
jgi:hypothetical protein